MTPEPHRDDDDGERPRITFRGSKQPKRIYIGWPVLTVLGAGVGFVMGSWPGLVLGGVLGYLAWRLR